MVPRPRTTGVASVTALIDAIHVPQYASRVEWLLNAWAWFGGEIAAFGIRWLIVIVLLLLFAGFLRRRQRQEIARLEDTGRGVTIKMGEGVAVKHSHTLIFGHKIQIDGQAEITTKATLRIMRLEQ